MVGNLYGIAGGVTIAAGGLGGIVLMAVLMVFCAMRGDGPNRARFILIIAVAAFYAFCMVVITACIAAVLSSIISLF